MPYYYWQTFVMVSAITFALTWRYSPHLGRMLPDSVRQAIRNAVVQACPSAGSSCPENQPQAEESKPSSSAPNGAIPTAAVADKSTSAVSAPSKSESVNRVTTSANQPATADKIGAKATSDASNVSPFLKPAADAYREYKKLSADLERRGSSMDMAEQRKLIKKVHYLRERVESLNRKHREWKQAHPQK